MIKKSTLYNHVNRKENPRKEGVENLEMKMQDSNYLEQYAPSDQCVQAILGFASSYFYLKSLLIEDVEMNLN